MAENFGLDPWRFITELPLDQVIEIHLSGGRDSNPTWLPSRRVQRLDSHDDLVPEPVWALFDRVLPLCHALDAVILERMEGTVTDADVAPIAAELVRIRERVEARRLEPPTPPIPTRAFPSGDPAAFQSALESALRSPDPAAFATAAHPHLRPDDLRLTALHVARLRSERLLQGSPAAASWFDLAPADFAAAFWSYHQQVPPTGLELDALRFAAPEGVARLAELHVVEADVHQELEASFLQGKVCRPPVATCLAHVMVTCDVDLRPETKNGLRPHDPE
jgi:hypothetical protein